MAVIEYENPNFALITGFCVDQSNPHTICVNFRIRHKNRIYGNAANQVFRSSIDDGAKLAIFSNSIKSKQPIG